MLYRLNVYLYICDVQFTTTV